MKKLKKIWALILMAVLLISLTGCGKPSTEKEADDGGFTVTITDHAGREVTLTKRPETVASCYYIATSMLVALGQADKLVGVENTPEKRPLYKKSAPKLLELPTLGTVKEFDLEKCAAIKPDLVILPYKLKEVAKSLEELNIPVIVIQPESEKLLAESIAMIGAAMDCTKEAASLQDFIDKHLTELDEALAGKDRPSVYLSGNSSFLLTAGPEMYQHFLITSGGGRNVAEELTDTYWAEISYEQFLAWDPDYIVLAADATYTVEDVLSDPILADCTAVKNRAVYHIPNDIESWDSPVPSSVLGCLWMASVLHEDAYTKEQYEAAVEEYYGK